MKRGGPLRRTKPLESRSLLKRAPFVGPRKRLNPISVKQRAKKREASEQVAEEGAAFFAAIKGKRCVVCGRTAARARKDGTRHQAHHAVSKQRLKKLLLGDWLYDPRNAVCVCEDPCHAEHTSAKRRIPMDALPPPVWEFARELGIEHVLVREYAA